MDEQINGYLGVRFPQLLDFRFAFAPYDFIEYLLQTFPKKRPTLSVQQRVINLAVFACVLKHRSAKANDDIMGL